MIQVHIYTYMQYLNFQFLYDLRHHVMSTSVQEHEQISIPSYIRNGKSKILQIQISKLLILITVESTKSFKEIKQ